MDRDGSHKSNGLEVGWSCVGVTHPDEFIGVVKRLKKDSRGRRGPRRKHVALELTAHPTDEIGAKKPFRCHAEMEELADQIAKAFGAVYYLVGYHGLQDVHVLILNWGKTGLALKSYLPNRSNPRRVLVAVCDRVERELNDRRTNQGIPRLVTMDERRAEKRQQRNRRPMHEVIADRLTSNHEPTIVEILAAISACGWQGAANNKKVSISFSPKRSPLHFELDMFLVGLKRAWKKKIRDQDKAVAKPVVPARPHYETLVAAVNQYMRTGKYDSAAGEWLDFTDGNSATARSVAMKKALKDLLAGDASAGAIELRETIDHAAMVRDQHIRDKKHETQKGICLDP